MFALRWSWRSSRLNIKHESHRTDYELDRLDPIFVGMINFRYGILWKRRTRHHTDPITRQHPLEKNGVEMFRSCRKSRMYVFYKKSKNVSCEYDRLNGWNSTLQAARGTLDTFVGRFYYMFSFIILCLWTKRTIWLFILSFTIYISALKI